MKGKIERGNRDRGFGEKEKRQGVLGKMPFFLPPIQNRGGRQGRPRPTAGGGVRGRRRQVIEGKRRGDRGDFDPVLTLGWGCLGRWLRGEVWAAAEASGGGAVGAAVEQGRACESSVVRRVAARRPGAYL
jgi:hypothetical protein